MLKVDRISDFDGVTSDFKHVPGDSVPELVDVLPPVRWGVRHILSELKGERLLICGIAVVRLCYDDVFVEPGGRHFAVVCDSVVKEQIGVMGDEVVDFTGIVKVVVAVPTTNITGV